MSVISRIVYRKRPVFTQTNAAYILTTLRDPVLRRGATNPSAASAAAAVDWIIELTHERVQCKLANTKHTVRDTKQINRVAARVAAWLVHRQSR
jgi:cobalamin biosynthesis protein CbiD